MLSRTFRRTFLIAALCLPVSLLAQEDNVIHVGGHGEVRAAPDTGTVTFSIEGQADSPEAARDRADGIAGALVEALEALGVQSTDIRSTPVTLYPFTDRQTRRELIRFSRTTTVTLRDLDLLEQVQQAALDAGVNSTGGMQFSLSNERELFNEATQLALEDARQQAESVARVIDVGLGPVLSVSVSRPQGNYPQPRMEAAVASDAAVPNFRSGEVEITADVDVRYAIERR